MPPKSNKKDQQKSFWYTCDKCGFIITQEQLQAAEGNCCHEHGIQNDVFVAKNIRFNVLPQEIELKEAPLLYLERFIFIPESVCNFCNFTMNCNVVLECGEKKHVKYVWSISDKYLDAVFTNSKELSCEKGEKIKISRLKGNVKFARKIILTMNEDVQDTEDLERLVRAKLKDTIINPTSAITVEFLSKTFTFNIQSIEEILEDDITAQFSHLDLSENFYLIQPKTLIKIISSNEKEDPQGSLQKVPSMGSMDEIIEDVRRIMSMALVPSSQLQLKISRGILIYGLSGCGKTMLSNVLAESYESAHKIHIDSWKIFSKFYGESESNLRKKFDEAFATYPSPCIIIIDEISNICPKNDTSDVVKKVSSLLISLLDSLHIKRNGSKIFVIATTSNLDNVDPGLRRSGRLDYEIEVPVPNTLMREKILTEMLKNYNINNSHVKEIAKLTHGYVGADLDNLVTKSIRIDSNPSLSFENIINNISTVKPSAMRELLVEKPNVKWSDIGGMADLKLKLKQIVEWPINHPETFERLGIKPPRGLLMFGPPGCSKTMIAKALATESNLNFISIKGSDLFSMWVGESEKAVRDLFIKARQLSPCIIFFDEIDAIGSERESGSSVKERVLAQILTEIDGVNVLKNVIIIAATNRPDLIDTALMRPGRLDRIVYVTLPDAETRREIFKIKLAKIPIASDVNIDELVVKTEGYSGAEVEAVCKEAALKALEHSFDVAEISMEYFLKALEIVTPRTSRELLEIYSDYEKRK